MAREQLGLLIDEKLADTATSCYEAYTAYAAAPLLEKTLEETGMYRLFREVEMPLVFTLYNRNRRGAGGG